MSDFLSQARAAIGAPPLGSPAELQGYARWLDAQAERFAVTADHLVGIENDSGLHSGPYADRTKREAAEARQRILSQLARETQAAAAETRASASRLEHMINDWTRAVQRKAHELENAFHQKK
jgi:hypothetical protein